MSFAVVRITGGIRFRQDKSRRRRDGGTGRVTYRRVRYKLQELSMRRATTWLPCCALSATRLNAAARLMALLLGIFGAHAAAQTPPAAAADPNPEFPTRLHTVQREGYTISALLTHHATPSAFRHAADPLCAGRDGSCA